MIIDSASRCVGGWFVDGRWSVVRCIGGRLVGASVVCGFYKTREKTCFWL